LSREFLKIREPTNHQEEVVYEVILVKAVMVLGKEDESYNTIIMSEAGCFRDFVGGAEDGCDY